VAHLAFANFLWVRANWEGAERELLKASELAPNDAMVHRVLANFYLATNRAPAAEAHLKKVAEITKDPAATFALADYYTRRRNPDAARSILQPLTETLRTAALAETKLATIDFAAGQSDAAHRRLNRVLEQDNANLPALLTRTTALLSEGNVDQASVSAKAAVEHHEESAEALFALARVQMARREADAAIASLNEVLRLNPRATDAKVALARLHLASGRADISVGLAEEAVALDPQNLEARLTVVRSLLARKELSRAESELATLAQKYPTASAVHALNGVLAGMKGSESAAKAHFERAQQLDPKSLEALRGLVAIDIAARRTSEARARVESRVAEDPRNGAALLLAAQTFGATGDQSRAEGYLRQLLMLDASHLEAYSGLAEIYMKQGRLDAALAEFDELARRQPRPVAALTFAGTILQGQGKTEQARDRFTRALELDPEAAVAANNLAWMYAEAGDRLDAALGLAQRAKAKLPKSHEVDDTLGFVQLKRNAPAEAIPHFERSVAAAPANPVYQYHLGLARAKAGDTTGARAAFDRAVALKPGYPEAISARETLSSAGTSH
jgi:tetratricopeptide (TPR) repeat protein